MTNLSVIIRMADETRKAAVDLPGNLTIAQLVQATQQNWSLPNKCKLCNSFRTYRSTARPFCYSDFYRSSEE